MKIIIIGASGTIGKKVTSNLEKDHEIIKVGTKSGDFQADITHADSITALFKAVGPFDALVSVTGAAHFGPLKTMTAKDFQFGLTNKLLGQINLVLIGQHYINPNGSFTLTSGILSDYPVFASANLTAVNAAINGFALAAALEMDNGVRINAVSPGLLDSSTDMFDSFPDHIPVTMDEVVDAYRKAVLEPLQGQIIKVAKLKSAR